eukprot:8167371-Pyramimonas_sp.AAC.1
MLDSRVPRYLGLYKGAPRVLSKLRTSSLATEVPTPCTSVTGPERLTGQCWCLRVPQSKAGPNRS